MFTFIDGCATAIKKSFYYEITEKKTVSYARKKEKLKIDTRVI